VNCFVTALAAGSSAGDNDVDGGMTSIQSPPIALPAGGAINLRFRYYLAHLNNASSADYFRIRVVGNNGQPLTLFTRSGSATNLAGAWSTQTVSLSAFAGQTVRIRFEARDFSAASLIEAGVDNVAITRQ
jgi:hypothetical protein